MAKHGRREYVQVLRLLESFEFADLHAAVKQAIQLGAIGFDAVKHLIVGFRAELSRFWSEPLGLDQGTRKN